MNSHARVSSVGARSAGAPTAGATSAARALLALAMLHCAACDTAPPASEVSDLVLSGGRIVTVDDAMPEGEAIAVRGDRILAVGSVEEISQYVGELTEVVELGGRLVVPGFIETHGHFVSLGDSKLVLELAETESWDDIVERVAEAARSAAPGAWIRGRGWHQEKWERVSEASIEGVPRHDSLSAVSPDNPVFLTHASGHAAFANSRALEAGGIGRDTPDPDGGTIVRDASGEATGLLRETAQRRVEDAWRAAAESRSADEREAEFRRQVELAGQDALAKGVTSFHDAGSNFAVIDRLMEMAEAGELPVRLYVMVRGESNENLAAKLAQYRTIGLGNGFLTVRAIKRQLDGALGAHGAWMLEPYADLPQSSGLVLEPVADIEETARLAIQHSYQLNVHAIGDRANREVLDLYERAFNAAGVTGQDVRWRIEHAQHLDVADIPRFAELGVIAAMQGVHATSDGPWVPDRIGAERARTGAYLWRTLLDSGARIVNGTDTPVEDVDPIASFYASVSRRLADGSVFFGAERMTRAEALRSYTLDAAYAGFEEDVKGSITPGKLADLVVLSKDILVVPEDEILTARVDVTILGGKVRYRRSPSSAERAVRVLAPNDNNLQWLTFWVAEGAGYFADESLQVEVTPGGTGDEEGGRRVTQALIDGSADVVIQPRPLFLLAVGEQLPVVAFANLLRNDPINLVVQREIAKAHGLSPESPLADRLEALRGLKIGVAPGPVPRLRVLAAAAGLNPDRDIEIVIVPGETQNESFGNRSVDALYAHTPYLETALSEQDGVLVVNQSAGEVPALADRQIHMLVTTRQFRDANPDVLLRMTRAVYRAQRLIHSDSEATLTAIRASSVRLRAPEALALIVELYAPAVPETPAVSVEGALAEMAFFPGRRAPPDLSGVDMATYVDNSFAAQVQAEH